MSCSGDLDTIFQSSGPQCGGYTPTPPLLLGGAAASVDTSPMRSNTPAFRCTDAWASGICWITDVSCLSGKLDPSILNDKLAEYSWL